MPRDDDDTRRDDDRDEPRRRDDYDDRDDRPRRRRDDPPEPSSNAGKVVLIVIAVFGLFMCVGIGGCVAFIGYAARQAEKRMEEERREADESKKNPIVISPTELVNEYKSNAVAADNRFKNKWLRVEGEVKRVTKHLWSETKMDVVIGSNQRFEFTEVQCVFEAEATAQVMKIKAGDTVTILGRCKGKSGDVELVDCEFVK